MFNEYCKTAKLKEEYALKDFISKGELNKTINKLKSKLALYKNCTNSIFKTNKKGNQCLIFVSSQNNEQMIKVDQLKKMHENNQLEEIWDLRCDIE